MQLAATKSLAAGAAKYPLTASALLDTLRRLRDGTLFSAPRKMPLCPAGIACFFVCALHCAPAPLASAFIVFHTYL